MIRILFYREKLTNKALDCSALIVAIFVDLQNKL